MPLPHRLIERSQTARAPAHGADDGLRTPPRQAFWRGFRDGAPHVLAVAPFGMVFGIVGTEAGLNLAQVMGFTIIVIAGAAQIAAVQMMADNAPTVIVLATALAVNLRMAMYSAALAPALTDVPIWKRGFMAYLLVDQTYALSTLEYDRRPAMTSAARAAYFFGTATPICGPWVAATWVGAVLGASVPLGIGLDFAVPITFLALVAPMLRTLPHVAAASVSVAVALLLAGLPYGTGLLLAAGAAMVTGAMVEQWQERRRAARAA